MTRTELQELRLRLLQEAKSLLSCAENSRHKAEVETQEAIRMDYLAGEREDEAALIKFMIDSAQYDREDPPGDPYEEILLRKGDH